VRKERESAMLTVIEPGWALTHFHSPDGVRTCGEGSVDADIR